MKKTKMARKIIFVCISKALLIGILVLLLLVYPTAKLLMGGSDNIFSQKFFGKKANYQGIIRLWNIDSFEGGSLPKSSFLEKLSMKFEKQNKGVFIKVENLSEDEVVASLKMGIYPDLVSFGTGMQKYFEGKFLSVDDSVGMNLMQNFYSAGLKEGSLKAVAYMSGLYCLISTTDRIENAGKSAETSLSTLAFALAQDIQLKKQTKHIHSLTFGKNAYTSAFDAFSRKFPGSSVHELASSLVIDQAFNSQTPYDAYEKFVTNKSNMLLGSQRDVFRMENRVRAGKESNVIYEPIQEYTDLVQYLSILSTDKNIYNVCMDFIKFVLLPQNQSELSNIGMFSVCSQEIYDKEPYANLQNAFKDNMIVKNLF